MRTLALLAALLLLAYQTQAVTLGERDDQVPALDQTGAEVQDLAISFAGDERSTRDASDRKRKLKCKCKLKFSDS
uniref:Paneth cell-specific alpha-defensin 32L n=1 Tax=Equus caballus TaxID=9796 RepID=C8BNI5_HORSE|nr:Paneth cell-specific alpha-defensin 32L precursor [Equus caballus]ACV49758.1 Paneth cell-specific alpha-defensin 32L [Equus caballus]